MIKFKVENEKGITTVTTREDVNELEDAIVLSMMAISEKYDLPLDYLLSTFIKCIEDNDFRNSVISGFNCKDNNDNEEGDENEYDIF